MSNEKQLPVRPSLYAMYFEGLKRIAHEHGYNLCIHGSMNRDFDLVAFPWRENISAHFVMVDALREYLGGRFNVGNNAGDLAAKRQHGRIGYLINIWRNTPFTDEKDQEYYLDIAVFLPPSESTPAIDKTLEEEANTYAASKAWEPFYTEEIGDKLKAAYLAGCSRNGGREGELKEMLEEMIEEFGNVSPAYLSAYNKVVLDKARKTIAAYAASGSKAGADLVKVVAVQDQDGHWYVIPAEMKKDFFELEERGHHDQYEHFNEKFSEYLTGGDLNLVQLYALSGSKTEGEQRLEFADTIIEQQQVRIDQLEAKLKDTKGENEAIKLLAKELSTHVGRGYDAKHDDEHTDGALADMAAIYCCTHRTDEMRELNLRRLIWGTEPSHIYENGIRSYNDWFTEQPDRVTELVKAGALIVAEILRLLRQKGKQ